MSTNKLYAHLKQAIVKKQKSGEKLPQIEAVNLFLKLNNSSISKLATQAGVSTKTVYREINGEKKSPRLRKTVEKEFGFIPW